MATRQAVTIERAGLNALAQGIAEHPEVLRPVSAAIVERMRPLVAGVVVDLRQPLAPELIDAGML
ncbi:MAG: transcriptional regulator [Burkholderiales bacterium]|nr:MAG: transcriptional regulator [Burkholderiales bacterium]